MFRQVSGIGGVQIRLVAAILGDAVFEIIGYQGTLAPLCVAIIS